MEKHAHYISGTHWDREWYRSFEEYRFLLVNLVDSLMDLMERNEAFRYFQLDGQTCMLEDYLDIRPGNRERLEKLISDGRILIGPWYTMPDLFCPDGESLIRNLLLGKRVCREWGVSAMPVGFICDMFGHPSQIPQIFAGFGIKDIVMGRGTNESTTDMFFDWISPDGSSSLTYKLQDKVGYGAFARPRSIFEGDSLEALQQIQNYESFKKELDEAADDNEYNAILERWGGEELAKYVNYELDRANLPVVAVMDTMDHTVPASDVERYLRMIGNISPDIVPEHSNLPAFFSDLRKQRNNKDLQEKFGELREPSREKCGYLYLIPNCVSSRVRLKLAGDATALQLQRLADPLVAIGQQNDEYIKSLQPFLERAWKLVLTNHAHDSVCGCSIDQVHRDMQGRFEQAQVIGQQISHQVIAALTAECPELAQSKDEFTVILFNPLLRRRKETVEFDIDFPTDYSSRFHEGFRTQEVFAFTLEDAEGNPIPYQRLSITPKMNERSKLARYCHISNGLFDRYRIAATVDLPAFGYTSLRVKPSPRPVRAFGSMRTGPTSAENDYLVIRIAPNGTLELKDKVTGEIYTDLLLFEDSVEIGDGWFHGNSVNGSDILSSASSATVSVLHDGPEAVTFSVAVRLPVPENYDWHRERPSENIVDLLLTSEITLRRGARIVDVTTTVDNRAEDHRLQLLLPTDIPDADTYQAHTAFDIVNRKIALDIETHNWQEAEVTEKPFESCQSLGYGNRGLAFISAGGLHEGGVRDDNRRTMQVTLLRSFRRTVGTEGEQDGLEAGKITCRYALMPFKGKLPELEVFNQVLSMQSKLITRQSGKRPSGYPALKSNGSSNRSFITLEGDLVFSTLKPSDSGDKALIMRLWNPAANEAIAKIKFNSPVAEATMVGLNEEPVKTQKEPLVNDTIVTVTANSHRIVTLCIKFD